MVQWESNSVQSHEETLMSAQIAVFIDFENIALWAEQEFLDLS